jgi:hypothetical protein
MNSKNTKNIFHSTILLLIVFSLCFGDLALAAPIPPVPPAALPTGSAVIAPPIVTFPTSDQPTEINTGTTALNTNILVTNTFAIATSLSGVTGGTKQDSWIAGLMMMIVKRVLREFTKSVVAWINSGFEGNPSFITNTEQWLTDTADITIGDFLLNNKDLKFLCDPFKINVQLALGLQYRPFSEDIKCSFTSATGNITDAYNNFVGGDFIGGGGWNSWLQLTTVPQNNQMGAMMIAQGELDARIEAQQEQAKLEANWGNGFLSWKKCEKENTAGADPEDFVYDESTGTSSAPTQTEMGQTCTIQTPGQAIADQLSWISSTDLRQSEIANDINEIINALANQLIVQGMQMFTGSGLLGAGKSSSTMAPTNYSEYLTAAEKQQLTDVGIDIGPDGTFKNENPKEPLPVSTDPVEAAKTEAIKKIQAKIAIEEKYTENVTAVLGLLINGEENAYDAFRAKLTCNPQVINVLKLISGTTTYSTADPSRLASDKNLNAWSLNERLKYSATTTAELKERINKIYFSTATTFDSFTSDLNTIGHTKAEADSFEPNPLTNSDLNSDYGKIAFWLSVMQYAYKGKPNISGDTSCRADLSMWDL